MKRKIYVLAYHDCDDAYISFNHYYTLKEAQDVMKREWKESAGLKYKKYGEASISARNASIWSDECLVWEIYEIPLKAA